MTSPKLMNVHSHDLKRAGAGALTLALALALSACGGGGGNPGATVGTSTPAGNGSGGATAVAPKVTVTLVNASGQVSNTLSGAIPLTAKATVTDATGKPVSNAIVTFATDAKMAVITPSTGTALTDANGVASVTLRAANLATAGAATVTATSSVGGPDGTGSANFSVNPAHAYLNGDPSKPVTLGVANDLGTASSANPFVFSLLISDAADNPLPVGTTISVDNLVSATAQTPSPAIVSNVPSIPNSPVQGSMHAFAISSSQTGPCTAAANATFNVVATTPTGNATYIPFKLTFSCP